jgi:hypothetical protein
VGKRSAPPLSFIATQFLIEHSHSGLLKSLSGGALRLSTFPTANF